MIQLLFLLNIFFSSPQSELADPAPNFQFETIDGKKDDLTAYKGKVIYLSIWASWCKPCINNYEKYESVREQLAEEGVILLNVSIDKNPDLWRAAVAKHSNINGINVLSSDITTLMNKYRITKTPDYHIIDKTGNFVFLSDNAGRDIVAEFKAWL